jgi:hypothetical protein
MKTLTKSNVRLFASSNGWIEAEALRQLYAVAKFEGMRLAAGFPDLQMVDEVLDARAFKLFGLGNSIWLCWCTAARAVWVTPSCAIMWMNIRPVARTRSPSPPRLISKATTWQCGGPRLANGSRTSKQRGRTGNRPPARDFRSKMRHYWDFSYDTIYNIYVVNRE